MDMPKAEEHAHRTRHAPQATSRGSLLLGVLSKALLTGPALQRWVLEARCKNKPYNKLLVPVAAAPYVRTPVCWAVFRFRGSFRFVAPSPKETRRCLQQVRRQGRGRTTAGEQESTWFTHRPLTLRFLRNLEVYFGV